MSVSKLATSMLRHCDQDERQRDGSRLSIIVKLLGYARRLYKAFQLVEDLSNQNGFRPNVQVYTCLTEACVMRFSPEHGINSSDFSTYWTISFSANIPEPKCCYYTSP